MAIWSIRISISSVARVYSVRKHGRIMTLTRTGCSPRFIATNVNVNSQWVLKPRPKIVTNAAKQCNQGLDCGLHSVVARKSTSNQLKHAASFSTSTPRHRRHRHDTQAGAHTHKLFPGLTRSSSSSHPLRRQYMLNKYEHIHTPLAVDSLYTSSTRNWFGHARLTPEQVNYLLRQYEFSQIVGTNDSPLFFVSNQLPSNSPMEDRRAKAQIKGHLGTAMFFGVFDGHRGPACAQGISERLFNYIAAEALPYHMLLEAHSMFNRGEWTEMVDWFHHPNDYTSQERAFTYQKSLNKYLQDNISMDYIHVEEDLIVDALITAFERLDKDLTMEALAPGSGFMKDEALHTVFSGSCACVAYIDGNDVFVANAGDCRAVVGSQDVDGLWFANCLSVDHNARNNDEIERIRRMHPPNESSTVIKNGRLLSELAPLRAFGDVRYKWAADTQRNVLNPWYGTEVVPRNYHTPPYLVATPEVTHHTIQSDDKFLILATDGLWDCMTPQRAVSLVGDHLLLQKSSGSFQKQQLRLGEIKQQLIQRRDALHPVDSNAATHLIRYAIGGAQNKFDHDRLAHSLSLPDDISRQYRDDITVIIVYF